MIRKKPTMRNPLCHRRQFLQTSALTAGAVAAGTLWNPRTLRAAAPSAEVFEIKVISQQPHYYCGWPTLARRTSGELMLVWSGTREGHVCPFGTVQWMTSSDQGETWTWPRTLLDSVIDDRDAGVLETAQGSILVTTFSSLAYERILSQAEEEGNWPEEKLRRWQAAGYRVPQEQRAQQLGTWMLRSTDGGLNWSARYDCLVNSPHGPIQLGDGRLLYAGKQLWRENPRVGVAVSEDDGLTWSWLAEIPPREGDDPNAYHELHAVETGDGRIIAQIRNHNAENQRETLQSESSDGGETWSRPRPIGVWGLPSHLLQLQDGRLLMTYGHRRAPIGNLARISEDAGKTWSEPITISDDAPSGDMGYPTTVQNDDGSLVTVWYEKMRENPNAVLRQARWQLG
jgi:sialidase-1